MVEASLEEARLKYPVGTKFKGYYNGVMSNRIDTVKKNDLFRYYDGNDKIGASSHASFIFERGLWAKIIFKPNQIREIW